MSGSVVRVVLPAPLRALSGAGAEIAVSVPAPVTLRVVLDAVEGAFPSLRGTMRDHVTQQRRAFVRF